MAWTAQQESAINARDTSLIVSAAAGSGKTAVLTERLIQLIADSNSGVRADRMIVVTFTNDAAAELKKRLDMKLRALINEHPDDRHLLRQQVLLQNAHISTINSFCFDLLRDNITDQGITSGFGVLDESDNNVLKVQAMEELLDYYTKNEYETISFLYDKFCIRNEKRLVEVISHCDAFLASVALRDMWLDRAEEEYRKEFCDSVYCSSLVRAAIEMLTRALRISDDCCGLVQCIFPDMSSSAAEKLFAQAELENDHISALITIFSSGRLPDEAEIAENSAFPTLAAAGKTPHNKELREVYKRRREQYKGLVRTVIDSISSVESDYRESAEVTSALTGVIRKYEDLIWERKCEKNSISFDDGERLALELLAEIGEDGQIVQSETAKRISEYYDIIMIDEYQDSNNKEDLIFKLLSHGYKCNDDSGPMYGDNAFLVGDVKQSIYGFRLANPRNFVHTLRTSDAYDPGSDSVNQAIVLNRNFRSTQGVIDFVNYVFGQIMTEKCGGISYTDDEKLYCGAQEYDGMDETEFRTQIALVNCDEDEEEESDEPQRDPEAAYTAGVIAKMLRDGALVAVKDGAHRPCRPSDFCILVRKNRFINIYADELERLGIPAKRSEESGYLQSREIAILTDLLRIINNPLLDIPLTAVLTSPMYMFAVPEIAQIRALDKKLPLYSVLRRLADGEYDGRCDMFLTERCRDFLDALDKFRLDAVTMTTGELISSIYDTTDFISVMQLGSDADKKRANLRALIQYARSYEDSVAFEGTGGLGGFLRHIDRVIENGDQVQGKTSAASGDYVMIQTLHGSKGLEYPFVFIAETSTKFKYDSDIVMCSDDGRIGYILYDKEIMRKYRTFQQVMLSSELKQSTRSEEMRLLYVGLTRARQRLFINLKTGEKAVKRIASQLEGALISGGDCEDIITGADCFADWIWASLMHHRSFREIAVELSLLPEGAEIPFATGSEDIFDVVSAANDVEAPDTEEDTVSESEPDERICCEINAIMNNRYDTALSEMPAKLSVTQITKKFRGEEERFDFRLRRPKFTAAERTLTGAERGTAIHTFFQYCDFQQARQSPSDEIGRIREMGYISRSEADSIDCGNVSAFFESELYARISAAERVWRERKFMVAVSQLDIENELMDKLRSSDGMIKGIIDLMFEENGGLVIVDYKSDRGISAEKAAERYSTQLKLYRSAIELTTKMKVRELYLYSFELKKAIKLDI